MVLGKKGLYKRRLVMSEVSFVEFVLKQGLSFPVLHEKYGVSHQVWVASRVLYKHKYGKEFDALKSARYAASKMGNRCGARGAPAVVLDRVALEAALAKSHDYDVVARELGTSGWFVRANMKYYGLTRGLSLPAMLKGLDEAYVDRLEFLVPGIKDAWRGAYHDRETFFNAMYAAHCAVQELAWFIKENQKAHAYHIERGLVPRNHVSWGTNRFELRLSQALVHTDVLHQREVTFGKNYRADFAFTGSKLLVELDGAYHSKDAATKRRDIKKQKLVESLGYTVMRFGNQKVLEDTPWVVSEIQHFLLAESSASVVSASAPYGT